LRVDGGGFSTGDGKFNTKSHPGDHRYRFDRDAFDERDRSALFKQIDSGTYDIYGTSEGTYSPNIPSKRKRVSPERIKESQELT